MTIISKALHLFMIIAEDGSNANVMKLCGGTRKLYVTRSCTFQLFGTFISTKNPTKIM